MGEFIGIAVSAVVGLISGTIGSLIAPWVHWGIEKQKLKLLAHRELIEKVRRELKAAPVKSEFRESVIYSQIRTFLQERTRQMIESDTITVEVGGGRGSGADNYMSDVLDDLCILEKHWELL